MRAAAAAALAAASLPPLSSHGPVAAAGGWVVVEVEVLLLLRRKRRRRRRRRVAARLVVARGDAGRRRRRLLLPEGSELSECMCVDKRVCILEVYLCHRHNTHTKEIRKNLICFWCLLPVLAELLEQGLRIDQRGPAGGGAFAGGLGA